MDVQAKQMSVWTKLRWAQWAYMVFDKIEDVWQLAKMASCDSPSVKLATYTSLACEVSHNNQF